MKRVIIIGVVALVVLLLVIRFSSRKKVGTEVTTAKAVKTRIVETVNAAGKIQPETEVKISPDISGEITELYVKEGDSVTKGQLLLRIRPDNFQAVVENARASVNSSQASLSQARARHTQSQAQLLRAEAEYKRSKQLFEQKVISEADFQLAEMNYQVAKQDVESALQSVEAARFNMQSAQANLRQNLDNLSRTEIYAPMSGVVSKLSVEKGEKVVGTAQMAGTEMLIIANLRAMQVLVNVNENDIVRVRKGQKAEVVVESYGDRKFEGVVTEIANTANNTTTADAVIEFEVRILILNNSYQDLVDAQSRLSPFRPGMTASVDIITNRKDDALSVPIAAVTTRNASKTDENNSKKVNNQKEEERSEESLQQVVFVLKEDLSVEQRIVKTGISDFNNIEILSGIKEGEEIVSGPFAILSNPQRLKNGTVVERAKTDNSERSKK
ncbi:efflux RND transporter periplasmic adaptor subunit [Eisenibacter elegans]|uniref:efflux RND transporter periplasmic adaptor subunit n=1 Tax=Eisenibacter elegans TaxID=997 RepID=UPI0004184011|nr:efflux RND transporter periplasmic adaptor subunit [Eisenibacter elegans]